MKILFCVKYSGYALVDAIDEADAAERYETDFLSDYHTIEDINPANIIKEVKNNACGNSKG